MTAGILFTPFVAGAQSPWAWSDISRNIGQPRNRPVWAVAQARGFWYFTDGIGFENGGHVQRGNGMILADLTRALTRAGLLRVDDIVSDGKTVLFLKNVMGRSPLFEVVSFDGVKFVNRTERLRAWFDADEGIASVSGRDGQWAFVTTKGKVRIFPNFENLRSRPVATSGVEPVVPVGDLPQFAGAISYSIRHASPADGHGDIPVAIVPFDKGWLIAQQKYDIPLTRRSRARLTSRRVSDISSVFKRSRGMARLFFSRGHNGLTASRTASSILNQIR